MEQKRIVVFGLFGFLVFMLVFLLVFSSIASARMTVEEITSKLGEGVTQVIDFAKTFFKPIFSALFGPEASDSTIFARILILFLIYALSYIALKKSNFFIANKAIMVIVSAIVAILGMRYLPDKLINVILLPYGAFTIALSVLLPLLIYFFFVNEGLPESTSLRRLAWILFAAVFFGLWITRYKEVEEYNWIYILGIIGVGLNILLDGIIHRYYGIGKLKRTEKEPIIRSYRAVEEELAKLVRDYHTIDNPDIHPQIRRYWRTLLRDRKQLRKEIS